MSNLAKAIPIAALILLFFALMSRIDYVVNYTLYQYGLTFSYEWANSYWMTYNAIFIGFSIAVGFTYWIASSKTKTDFKISAALILTINLLTLGGLQDLMYFMLWAGGLPPVSVVWWWAPFISLIGTWNSLTQVGFTSLMSLASVLAWMLALRKNMKTKKFEKPGLFWTEKYYRKQNKEKVLPNSTSSSDGRVTSSEVVGR